MSEIKLTADSGGGTTALKAPSSTTSNADVVLKLPVADGSSGQVLKTDGSGQLSFGSDISDLVNDTSPQLGGALDTNGSNINFGDSTVNGTTVNRLTFGTATNGDLALWHDGNNSYIVDQGTGELRIRGAEVVKIQDTDSAENMGVFNKNGSVELYYNNSKKFETTSGGAEVFGELQMDDANSHIKLPDSARIDIGSSADLQIYHSGGENFIRGNASASTLFIDCCNELQIRHLDTDGSNSEKMIVCNDDGAVDLYHDNSRKLRTTTLGIDVESTGNTPTIEFTGAANLDLGKIDVDQFTNNYSMMRFTVLNNGSLREVYRILDSGQILLGKTSNSQTSGEGIVFSANGNVSYANNNTSDHDFAEFYRGTSGSLTRVGYIRTNGSATTYSTSSDYRLKENAVKISDGITRLKTLKPYRFNFKIDKSTVVDGFFAHEVTAVPEAITGTKDEVDSDNKPIYQGIDQSKLVPLLTAALQEAVGKIETLETKVAALEEA